MRSWDPRCAPVTRIVMAGGTLVTAAGIAAGVALAMALGRFLEALLFGVAPHDPGTFAGAVALQLAVALAAQYGPVRAGHPHRSRAEALRQQ